MGWRFSMHKERIKKMALGSGFKLKEQPNGEMDLNPYVYRFADMVESATSYKYESERKDRWISVEDRLPERLLQQCLIAHKDGGVMLAEYCEGTRRGEEIRYFQTHNNEYDLQGDYVEITHWQSLPKSPEGG